MVWVVVLASVVIGFVIGAGTIGREAKRLGVKALEPVWRLEEAAQFVGSELDFDIAARMSPDILRQLLRWHLNALQYEGDDTEAPSLAAPEEQTVQLYRRARQEGHEVSRPEVEAVIVGHLAYLRRIGAVAEA
jgi:hypothetical protein